MDTDDILHNDELGDSLDDLGVHVSTVTDDDDSPSDDKDISDELKNFGIELAEDEEPDNPDELEMDSYDDKDDF